jgi:hypothetical protein
MADRDAGDVAAPRPLADMDEWELTAYRQGLEAALAEAELPRYMLATPGAAKAASRASRAGEAGRCELMMSRSYPPVSCQTLAVS